MAKCALRRQTPEVGAECPNWARSDLSGGRLATAVPTANAIIAILKKWVADGNLRKRHQTSRKNYKDCRQGYHPHGHAMPAITTNSPWPALPLSEWADTCDTQHLWTRCSARCASLRPAEISTGKSDNFRPKLRCAGTLREPQTNSHIIGWHISY